MRRACCNGKKCGTPSNLLFESVISPIRSSKSRQIFHFTPGGFASTLDDVSDESNTSQEGSHGAPAGFSNQAIFKKKSVKKDSLGGMLMLLGVLAIVACVLSMVLSFLFIGSK